MTKILRKPIRLKILAYENLQGKLKVEFSFVTNNKPGERRYAVNPFSGQSTLVQEGEEPNNKHKYISKTLSLEDIEVISLWEGFQGVSRKYSLKKLLKKLKSTNEGESFL